MHACAADLNSERHLLHFRRRHDRAEDPAHQREELDLARHERAEGRGVAAADAVVVPETPACRRVPFVSRLIAVHMLDEAAMQRAGGGLVVILDEGELRCRARPACAQPYRRRALPNEGASACA